MKNSSENLRYMIVGCGGTGGAVGAHLARGGKDVTFIARGRHLASMRESGLRVLRPDGDFALENINACSMEDYTSPAPDVIFVCVKEYSLDDAIPFIRRVSGPDTVVIPILNVYGTGGKLQARLPELLVTDGCIYVASEISEPGVILMNGTILRVVFGLRQEDAADPEITGRYGDILRRVKADLDESGIVGKLSDNISRDTLLKFSYVSPQGACGLYYDVPAGPIQVPGEIRDCYTGLVREIVMLAGAMGIDFECDVTERNLKILDALSPDMTTSMQRDIAAGKSSEIDGLIYEVVRSAKRLGVRLPIYEKIAAELRERYEKQR